MTDDPSPIDGHHDHDVPWAMQVAVRYDKANPASRVDTCEAAARAVVALLASPEARDGAWHDAVDYWRDGRIRKLVRRARGAARWEEVQQLPGVTVEQQGAPGEGAAGARAFVPAPVQPLHPVLRKLQVEGTELPDTHPSLTRHAMVTIGTSPLVEMTTGKAAAQCGHAAQLAWEEMSDDERARWAADGHRVRVAQPSRDEWLATPGRVSVVDAGFTELDGPTETTRAWW